MKTLCRSTLVLFSLMFIALPARADLIWGTDASDQLTGSRSSSNGIDASASWDGGAFELGWNISWDQPNGLWTYQYTVNVTRKDPSHFILEVTEDGENFNTYQGTDAKVVLPPQVWHQDESNPDMPNNIYGVKFDFGGDPVIYTIVTDRAPVWGVFYAKDGKDNLDPTLDKVVAWSNALNYDYKNDISLTENDFIVRPDGVTVVPLPGAVWLFGSGLVGLVGGKRKFRLD